jgi:putative N6-adenine-specific DNA methylase
MTSMGRYDGTGALELAATCSLGLEDVVRSELTALGVDGAVAGRGVVRFTGTLATVYRANLWLRTAARVLVQLGRARIADREQLYALARGVAWERWFARRITFAVEVAGRNEAFASSAFAVLVVKDAIADRLRARWGERPNVERTAPGLRVHLHLGEAGAGLSLDASGEPLSHRGYRPRGGPAPLSESLAAGLLALAGYDGSQPFIDPMCGSGTIAIEAALVATNSPPGLHRRFACEHWANHDAALLDRLRADAARRRCRPRADVIARDTDPRAVAATRRNVAAAGVEGVVRVERGDIAGFVAPGPGCLIVTNPPYGQRLGAGARLPALYRRLGDALKHGAPGCTAWLLAGNRELAKQVGLRPAGRIRLFNGPIECRLLRFDLYEGSRKVHEARDEPDETPVASAPIPDRRGPARNC